MSEAEFSGRKQRVIEAIQVLLLSNASQKDYLDLALDCAVAEDWSGVELYIQLAMKSEYDMAMIADALSSGTGVN